MIVLYIIDSFECFGPFVSEKAAHSYASNKLHLVFSNYTLIKLRDSGDCLDYTG